MRQPLHLQIRRSRVAASLLIIMHGLGVAGLAASQMPLTFKFALLLILAWSMARSLQAHVFRSARDAVVKLTLRETGELSLEFRDGNRVTARIDPSSIVLYWLITLNCSAGKQRHHVWLLPDMLDTESWRQLSIMLRTTVVDVK